MVIAERTHILRLTVVFGLVLVGVCSFAQAEPVKTDVADKPVTTQPAATQPATTQPATQPATQPIDTQSVKSTSKDAPSWYDADDGGGVLSDGRTASTLWRMMAYILVILVVGAVGIVLVRKIGPKLGAVGGKGREISVIETIYLAPRKTLHLVQVGGRRFLLAGSRESTTMLSEVTQAFDEILKSKSDAGDEKKDVKSDESGSATRC